MIRRISIYTFILLASLVLNACIGEDDSDCNRQTETGQQLILEFRHSINPSYKNLIAEVVDSIDLYIYNASDQFLRMERIYKDDLELNDYKHELELEQGYYTLVAWMNSSSQEYVHEQIENRSTATNRLLEQTTTRANEGEWKPISPLYYAYKNQPHELDVIGEPITINIGDQPVEYVLNFAKNTNNIQVDAIFDRLLPENTQIEVEIKGKNSITNYVNKCPEDQPEYIYHQHTTAYNMEEKQVLGKNYYYTHTSYLNTLRLWQGGDIQLVIRMAEPGKDEVVLIDEPLIPLIMQNPVYYNDFQMERFCDYKLEFIFERDRWNTWGHVEIRVNGWYLINVDANLKTE